MRLLVAEDEHDLADALKEILTLNKYSVDVVYDGKEALDYISAVDYDGIILDIMMPKMNGIEVLKKIRQDKIQAPVILLTAKSETDDKVAGLDSGANDYLTKPFETKELLARIRAMTRSRNDISGAELHSGNVSLSRTTFTLYSDKCSFKLTNKEYQLMEMLMNNKGRYINSNQFMEKIWGYDSDSEINVVWTHISSLRNKLDKLESNIKIVSSRNQGYTLEEIK